ncbi:DUF309 domain-containing protein [Aquisphaera insulae]|uniref:DUF309 domain-containing protein n=1 Tax=Aquisphaera insulae TaxID=2712864 RepID=UPI0013EAB59D|nr:DUF309 domain-containing protein [Aquisphaera insulae]
MSTREPTDLPPYSYVPGGPWPHPTGSPQGHSWGAGREQVPPIVADDWRVSEAYLRGIELFNAGYYWEAHEAWEALWLAHGRKGPVARIVQALIKLAAAGVKIREGQPAGASTHAARAADLIEAARSEAGDSILGLDLQAWVNEARAIAERPPRDTGLPGQAISRVFSFRIEPRLASGPLPVETGRAPRRSP